MKHTPGPWHAQEYWEYGTPSEQEKTHRTIEAESNAPNPVTIANNVHIKNARLIASAPDLLKACQFIAARGEARDGMVHDAIAKATEEKA